MRLLCACYAPALRPLCGRYASAMRPLCWCMPGGRPPLGPPVLTFGATRSQNVQALPFPLRHCARGCISVDVAYLWFADSGYIYTAYTYISCTGT